VSQALFPYATLVQPPAFQVADVRLDGASRSLVIKQDEATVNLFEAKPGWQRVELDVELTADADAVGEFDRGYRGLGAVAVAHCMPTNARQPVRLTRSEFDPGRWEGTLQLDRDNFRSRATVVPLLTATVGGVPHRPVGLAAGWTLHFDEPESLRMRGTLRVRWVNFKAEDADPMAKQFSDSTHLAWFGTGQALPEVWLNSAFDGLESLLRDRKDRRGVEKGLHDMQRLSIARGVWMALAADALASVRGADDEMGADEPDWPEAEWQAEVLRRVLPDVAPAKADRELLALASTEWRSHPGAAEFYSRAEAVIGDMIRANETLRRFIQNYRGEETL
jgi:hypothetical protein